MLPWDHRFPVARPLSAPAGRFAVLGEAQTRLPRSGCHTATKHTIKAIQRGSSTVTDYWIPWSDIEPVGFGWEYARGHLPDDVAALLAACDGVEHLSLNSQIKNAIIESLPDWRERVMEVLESIDAEDL